MFTRKPKEPEGPALLDRIVKSGCQRVAILGLHAGAGTRTVLAALVRDLHRREWPFAVTSAPRLVLDAAAPEESVTRLAVPEGAYVATVAGAEARGDATLDRIEATTLESDRDAVGIYRVSRGGEVDLVGPTDSDGMRQVVERLGEVAGGLTFVDGGWERRSFAAPGTTEGIVLVVAAGYSATPERSAAAARYIVETLTVPPCGEAGRLAWRETASHGAAALIDRAGGPAGVLPHGLDDPLPALHPADGEPIGTVVLPQGLNDEFLVPLVRSDYRCTLVVRDATRISVSPVYFKAWLKGDGRIEVVRQARLIAVATNPTHSTGPDADPVAFRNAVSEALPELPIHDVVLESGDEPRRPVWKFWE